MRRLGLLPLLVALASPAVAEEERFTPRPVPTVRMPLLAPAAQPPSGPPLEPLSAFQPVPLVSLFPLDAAPPPEPSPTRGEGRVRGDEPQLPVHAPSPPPPQPVEAGQPPPAAERVESPVYEPPVAEPPVTPPLPAPSPLPLPPSPPPRKPASGALVVVAPPPPAKPAVRAAAAPSRPERSAAGTLWATESVYVRAAPDADSRIVDGLIAGDAVQRMRGGDLADGWVRVGRDGQPLGYIASRFLSDRRPKKGGQGDADCTVPDDIPATARRALPAGTRVRALTDAYLRAAPGCGSRVLDVLEEGQTMTVSGGADGWYEVHGQGWLRAFISARLVAVAGSAKR